MKLAILFWPLAVFILLTGSGCMYSEQPLSAVAQAKSDPRLIGEWQLHKESKPDDMMSFRVTFDEQGMGHVAVQKDPGGPWQIDPNFPGFFITNAPGGTSYLNLQMVDRAEKTKDSPPLRYAFYRYSFSDDGKTLKLQAMQTGPFLQAVEDGKLKGNILKPEEDKIGHSSLLLQESSASILNFIESTPATEILADPLTATKVPEH